MSGNQPPFPPYSGKLSLLTLHYVLLFLTYPFLLGVQKTPFCLNHPHPLAPLTLLTVLHLLHFIPLLSSLILLTPLLWPLPFRPSSPANLYTLSTDKLWLVGAPATQELPSSVLPNREEVLCVLQYHAKLNPRDLAFSVRQTALNVQHQYSKANIPTIDPCDILKKVRCLHEEYNGLKKSKSRTTGQAEES
ncbi:hypothetical protein GWK47_016067 [Chionoecetes opilio]|uniref:Uncharacterized protein n=1 Tax=Chionoecetes opilio TaxID=41210 RepID=A0A8J4XS42_CHIOP|nr:hypothetical protein GWK47_016067 [Chionoecetes opilio]